MSSEWQCYLTETFNSEWKENGADQYSCLGFSLQLQSAYMSIIRNENAMSWSLRVNLPMFLRVTTSVVAYCHTMCYNAYWVHFRLKTLVRIQRCGRQTFPCKKTRMFNCNLFWKGEFWRIVTKSSTFSNTRTEIYRESLWCGTFLVEGIHASLESQNSKELERFCIDSFTSQICQPAVRVLRQEPRNASWSPMWAGGSQEPGSLSTAFSRLLARDCISYGTVKTQVGYHMRYEHCR